MTRQHTLAALAVLAATMLAGTGAQAQKNDLSIGFADPVS